MKRKKTEYTWVDLWERKEEHLKHTLITLNKPGYSSDREGAPETHSKLNEPDWTSDLLDYVIYTDPCIKHLGISRDVVKLSSKTEETDNVYHELHSKACHSKLTLLMAAEKSSQDTDAFVSTLSKYTFKFVAYSSGSGSS